MKHGMQHGLPEPDGRWHYRGRDRDYMLWAKRDIIGSGFIKLSLHSMPTALYMAMTVGRLA